MSKTCFASLPQNEVDAVLNASGLTVLFKHSTRCSISSTALNRIQDFCQKLERPHNAYLVNVIQERPTSNALAEKLQVRHESPQLLILMDGKLAYHASHFEITEKSLLQIVNEA